MRVPVICCAAMPGYLTVDVGAPEVDSAWLLRRAEELDADALLVARPLGDAVKTVAGSRVVGGVDRSRLVEVLSPLAVAEELAASIRERVDGEPGDWVEAVVANGGIWTIISNEEATLIS